MTPRTIEEYLDQLQAALRGDDPALIQDALYDAEEYLRAELREQPDRPVAEVLAEIVASYGAPAEVAEAYRETERTVVRAMSTPARPPSTSVLGTVFGVFVDPRAYTSVIYMLVALATGVLYFTVAVTGLSLSLGLAITLIGIPLFLLFLALVRVLSLVEGRVVEAMLGVRMPRRPLYEGRGAGIWQRIGNMLTDVRTWTTLLYMVIQLPLGITYFVTVVVGFSISFTAMAFPIVYYATGASSSVRYGHFWWDGVTVVPHAWQVWLLALAGFILLVAMMHLSRFIGRLHGQIAKYLLVRF
jgi:hypothetical protein